MINQEITSKSLFDSIFFKMAVIGVVIIVLLIPSVWIQDLIIERKQYQQKQVDRVSENWSGNQLIQGPVLVLPYKSLNINTQQLKYIYILPDQLKIKANVTSEKFTRGIYDATVYNARINLQGNFGKADLQALNIDPTTIQLDKARLVFGISDIKGLKSNPIIQIGQQKYLPQPSATDGVFEKSLEVVAPQLNADGFTFNYQLDIKGSNRLNFLQLGKTTDVEVHCDWDNPVFEGRLLPDSRDTNSNGFIAKWHALYYNRPFPQQWLDNAKLLRNAKINEQAKFGVSLQLPVDQYHKVMRTAKYAILIVVLTFASLFLTELIRKQRIHVFNYMLIGAAMVVYYTLLLSFSEHTGFNIAYLIASVATITLVSMFTGSLLANKNAAIMFGSILTAFYGFTFTIVQLEEFALLVGSIALFVVVAALMYFSRKINWDNQ